MKELRAEDIPSVLHVIPLRNSVLFPGGVLPMTLSHTSAISAERTGEMGSLAVASVKNESEVISRADLFTVATVAQLRKFDRQSLTAELWGVTRCRIEFIERDGYSPARVTPEVEQPLLTHPNRDAMERMRMMAFRIFDELPDRPPGMQFPPIASLNHLLDLVTANAPLTVQQKQNVLEAFDVETRFKLAEELWSQIIAARPPVVITGAACALHELPATEPCERCGTFMCGACLIATTTRRCSNCRDRRESDTMLTRLSKALGFR